MVLFQLMATQGLSHAVRESLEGLVQWDVAVLHEVNLLEAHETGFASAGIAVNVPPGGLLAATVPETSSVSMAEEPAERASEGEP